MRGLKANRAAVDAVVALCNMVGGSLTASVVLATLGVPVVALGATLSILVSDCDGMDTLKQQARAASFGAKAVALTAGVGSLLTLLGVVSAAAAIPLGLIAAASTALVPVLDALGAGRAPRASDVSGAIGALTRMGGVSLPEVDSAGRALDTFFAGLARPEFAPVASELKRLQRSIPSSVLSGAASSSSSRDAANKRAALALVAATLRSPSGPWAIDTAGTSGWFALLRAKYSKERAKAGAAFDVVASWRRSRPSLVSEAELSAALAGAPRSLPAPSTPSLPKKAPKVWPFVVGGGVVLGGGALLLASRGRA